MIVYKKGCETGKSKKKKKNGSNLPRGVIQPTPDLRSLKRKLTAADKVAGWVMNAFKKA